MGLIRKPNPGEAAIDWSHPIARNMLGMWLLGEGGGPGRNLVKGNTDAVHTSVTGGAGPHGGKAPHYDGSASFSQVSSSLGIVAFPYTMSIWFRTQAPSVFGMGMSFGTIGVSTTYNNIGISTGFYHLNARNPSQLYARSSTPVDNAWAHICGVFASGTSKLLYVNGLLEGEITDTSTFLASPDNLYFGRLRSTDTADFHTGELSTSQIWNRGLSPEEVRIVYREPYAVLSPVRRRVWFVPVVAGSPTRSSAFNFCDPFDFNLPIADGSIDFADRHQLWGMYTGVVSDTDMLTWKSRRTHTVTGRR